MQPANSNFTFQFWRILRILAHYMYFHFSTYLIPRIFPTPLTVTEKKTGGLETASQLGNQQYRQADRRADE